jgi:hypothetical protein
MSDEWKNALRNSKKGKLTNFFLAFDSEIIQLYGSEEQKEPILPQLVSAEAIITTAITEPDAGTDASSASTRAVKEDNEWVINCSRKVRVLSLLHSERSCTTLCKTRLNTFLWLSPLFDIDYLQRRDRMPSHFDNRGRCHALSLIQWHRASAHNAR